MQGRQSLARPPWQRWAARLTAASVSLVASVVLVELTLRVVRDPHEFLAYHRNSVKKFYPNDEITPGVEGVTLFTTNSFGTRGPEPDGERFRILTVGGSTTACTILDDSETWPHLVMEELNERSPDGKLAWVTNSGIDGLHSDHHVLHAEHVLSRVQDLDYVLVYAGLNDLGDWLYQETFDPHFLDTPAGRKHRIGQAFRVSPYVSADAPWHKRLELWTTASRFKDRLRSARNKREGIVEDERLEWIEKVQAERRQSETQLVHKAKLDTLPMALDAYAANLERIIELARGQGVEPIFMSQAIQGHSMTEQDRERLWMGAMDGGEKYVDETQMLELLSRYNDRMQAVAEAHDVLFLDLPPYIQDRPDTFYDGCHLNEAGCRAVASFVAERLRGVLSPPRVVRALPHDS